MINIKLTSFWCDDNTIREYYNRMTINNDYIWKDLYITDSSDYDFVVVQGSTSKDYDIDYKKCIVIQNEPSIYRNANYLEIFKNPDSTNFFKIFDIVNNFPVDHWDIPVNFKELDLEFEKTKVFSGLISGAYSTNCHKLRFSFIKDYLSKLEYYDILLSNDYYLFRDFHINDRIHNELSKVKTILYKQDAYIPYRYTFQSENSVEPNYFTEKIIRSILCECLCFYYGCPNIKNFIHPDCYILIDLDKPEESIETIKKSIEYNEWSKRIYNIRKQKSILMNDNNPLNIIWNIIHNGNHVWKSYES